MAEQSRMSICDSNSADVSNMSCNGIRTFKVLSRKWKYILAARFAPCCLKGKSNRCLPASYLDVSLSRWTCARKGRREGDNGRDVLRLACVPFPWFLAVHHQSLASTINRLYLAKNEAPEEEAGCLQLCGIMCVISELVHASVSWPALVRRYWYEHDFILMHIKLKFTKSLSLT